MNQFQGLGRLVHPGVISRGAQGGGAPLVETLDHFGGAQHPLEILALALLFKVYSIDIASKVFSTAMLNYALLRGY